MMMMMAMATPPGSVFVHHLIRGSLIKCAVEPDDDHHDDSYHFDDDDDKFDGDLDEDDY